jgi:DNA mismatch endonuclease (patch repair protein)
VADVLTKKKRSQVMAAIRSRGNKSTELKLASILRAAGITGWRRHQPIPGRPDFIFPRHRLAVFVDGCFWHGCRWHCRMPRDNRGYWRLKIARNKRRDRAVSKLLRIKGWRIVRIWGHSLCTPEAVASRVSSELNAALRSCNNTSAE